MFYVRIKNKKRVIVLISYISRVFINKQYLFNKHMKHKKYAKGVDFQNGTWWKNLSSFKIGTSDK